MKYNVYLFVDGSSSRREDIGAWGAIVCYGDKRKVLYGVDWPTTISRCELRPIIEGLRWIKKNLKKYGRGLTVCVYSDSEYTVKTLCGVYERGTKNLDLWSGVDVVSDGLKVTFKWRERNSLPYMTMCDTICGGLRRKIIDYMKTVLDDPRVPEHNIPFYTLEELEQESDE